MQVKWVIIALRALGKWFWPGSRNSSSPVRPTVAGPLSESESSHTVSNDVDTDPQHPLVDDIPSGNLDYADGALEELPVIENGNKENGITASYNTTSEPSSELTPGQHGSPDSNSSSVDEPPYELVKGDREAPVATAPSADIDQECSLTETGRHSQGDDHEEDRYDADGSTEQPQKPERKPRDIGGRRDRQSPNQRIKARPQSPPSRPELICRRNPGSTTWEVTLTADEECMLLAVRFEGKLLNHSARECSIPSFTGQLNVSCQDEQQHDIPLFEGDPLIFKLRKNWLGEGRRISRMTSGHFIVIAPATWERAGSAPVEPDGCADTGFRAHYFYRDATTADAGVDGFREWGHSHVASGIELRGQRVFDDSDEGVLIVGAAPNLEPSPEIVWARVGEEIELGWGQTFRPDEQSLPEILNGREGWFFLRVFDSEAKLIDSTSFRYLSNLSRICVNGTDYTQDTVLVPSSTGYLPMEVRFVGPDGSIITPSLAAEALQDEGPSGELVVPPHPDADRILCTISTEMTEMSGVDIVLNLPRIWWRLEDGSPHPGEWHDKPVIMTRQEFRRHAHTNVSVTLLSKRQTKVVAGFDDELVQTQRRLIEDDRIKIPLVHFVDHTQIDRRLNEDVHFNVEWGGKIVPLIKISADPMPEIISFIAEPARISARGEALLEWKTRNADNARVSIDPGGEIIGSDDAFIVRPMETTRYTLTLAVAGTEDISRTVTVTVEQMPVPGKRSTASVMSTGGGWKRGKGFSFRELRDAGVMVREAVERFIPIDRRRRTSHRVNVERVRSMFDD